MKIHSSIVTYIHKIKHTDVPYHSLYGVKIPKQYNSPFQNGGHKSTFLRELS